MKKKTKIIVYVAFFCFFLICISPFIKNELNSNCNAFHEFLQNSYKGIVVKKFINSEQHSYHTLEIKNFSDSNTDQLILDFDVSGFFNIVSVKDTFCKNSGSDTIYLINKNGKNGYVLDFDCKE